MKDSIEDWRERGVVRRLWRRDKSIWTSADEDKWLGGSTASI
jgi:transaldolase/glucose-6-phosphate isomerase